MQNKKEGVRRKASSARADTRRDSDTALSKNTPKTGRLAAASVFAF